MSHGKVNYFKECYVFFCEEMSLLLVSKQSSLTKQERIHDPEREAEIFYILPSMKYKKKI